MNGRAILLASVAVLLPPLTGSALAQAAAAVQSRFIPPTTPLVLTRTLYRELADGKQVVVTRRYVIHFSPIDEGYRIDGRLIGTTVDAPPLLARLAELERQRPDTGLFPAILDRSGMIRSGGGSRLSPELRQQALVQARTTIAQAPVPAVAKRETGALLGQVAGGSTGSAWPTFLFNPGTEDRIERRSVPLPNGGEGQVEVRIGVQGLMPGGLPHRLERVIVTRLDGSERTSREVWTITAAETGQP